MVDNKKKKSKNILPWVLLIVISIITGVILAIFFPDISLDIGFYDIPLLAIAFLFSFPLHIILHEVGHLIGGLLSGYNFIMFRLFNTVWINTDSGISKRKQVVQGIAGQALMTPPEGVDSPPFLLYHSSGLIMNLLTGILFMIIASIVDNKTLSLILYAIAVAAILLFITNLVPMKPNDGYNIVEQLKNPEATEEFTHILKLYAEMVKGTPFVEITESIDVESIESIENPNNVTLLTAKAAAYFEQFEFESARNIYAQLWNQRDLLLEPHKPEVFQNYLFSLLITEPEHADVALVKETKVYKNYSQLKLADGLKIKATEALYIDHNVDLAQDLLIEGRPLINKAPTIAEENLEHRLYNFLESEIARLADSN